MVSPMKNFALILATLPLAMACDSTKVSCGMLIHDEVLGACVCPPGVEVDYERWLCLFPDAAVPIDPFDSGVIDSGADSGTDAGVDSGSDGGTDVGPECLPTNEVCEGSVDEDCDGMVDEGCECADGASRECGPNQGVCEAGTQVCESGAWATCQGASTPGVETCEGAMDEDCDGSVDEGCACANGTTRPCPGGIDTGECVAGTQTCSGGAWESCAEVVSPSSEVCDGRDNDCDGVADGAAADSTCAPVQNGTAGCVDARCTIESCSGAFRNCNAIDADGCETDTSSSVAHCGACGRRCLDSQLCDRGTCVSIPVLVGSYVVDAVSGLDTEDGGPALDYPPRIAADTAGNLMVTAPYADIGSGFSSLIALSPTLTERWTPLDSVPFLGPASCNDVCVHWEWTGDRLMRHTHSRPIPVVSEMGRYSGVTSIAAMPSGNFLALAGTIVASPMAPNRAVRVQHDGRVLVVGLNERVYVSNGPRLVAVDEAGLVWTWDAGTGNTVVAASPSRETTPSGDEQGVYVMYTRTSGRTHLAYVDASSGLTMFSEPLPPPFADAPPFSTGTSILALNRNTVVIAGHELTGPDTDSAFLAVLDWDFQVRHVWGLGNHAEHRVTHLVRLSDQEVGAVGVALGSSLSTGGRSVPLGADGSFFVLKLRVQ